MDHPAIEIAPRPVTALAQLRTRKLDRTGLVLVDRIPDYPYDGPGVLLLGHLYPTIRLGPASGDLATFLSLPPVHARGWYFKTLTEAIEQARATNDPLHAVLVVERELWLKFDDQMLQERVYRWVDRLPSADGGHWNWIKRFDEKRPSVSLYGQDRVPVYSLLWPRVYPVALLAGKRAHKIEDCPDVDPFRKCVNPYHFKLASEVRLDTPRRLRTLGVAKDSGRYTGTITWSATNTDEIGRLVCPKCRSLIGDIYQQRYKLGAQKGTGWCVNCADIERQIKSGQSRFPRNGYMPLSPSEEDDMMQIMLRAEAARDGAQVVPPAEEPVRVWTEEDFQI